MLFPSNLENFGVILKGSSIVRLSEVSNRFENCFIVNNIDKNKNNKLTIKIREFNSHIDKDNRVENIILPIGDGLSICRKL